MPARFVPLVAAMVPAETSKRSGPSREVQRSQVTLKTTFTVAFGVLAVVALVAAVFHSLFAITLSGAALLLAVALDHAVQRLVKWGMKRALAIGLVGVTLLALLGGIAVTLIPPVISQGKALGKKAPEYVHTIKQSAVFQRLDERLDLAERIAQAQKDIPRVLTRAADPVLTAVGGLFSLVGASVSVLFLMMFMLIFGGPLLRAALMQTRPEHRDTYRDVVRKIYDSIGGYVGGVALICTVNATLTTVFLAITRMPFFLPLGILSGVSSMIPYAGPFVAGTIISALAFVTGGMWHGVATVIYFVVYGQLEGNVLGPLVFRRAVNVNPLVVTLSILFLGEIAGIPGAIVAVPFAASAQIILRELLQVRAEQLALQRKQNAQASAA